MTNPFKQSKDIWKISFPFRYINLNILELYFEEITDNIASYEISSKTVESNPDDIWRFEAYLEKEIDLAELTKNLLQLLPNWEFSKEISIQKLDDIDWVKKVQENFTPIYTKKFCITNLHHNELKKDNLEKIFIEASSACVGGCWCRCRTSPILVNFNVIS